jgi:exopolysaccharide biosynthesis WecB/TagA/CpsF family protein
VATVVGNEKQWGTMEQSVAASEGRHRFASVAAVIRKIDVIDSDADEARLLARLTRTERPLVVSFINQHIMNLACGSSDFAASLIKSDVLLRDGIGIKLCLFALTQNAGQNMCGTDFIPRIATAFSGRRTALFGTKEPWTSRAAAALEALGCRIVSQMDGFRPTADYVAEAMRSEPELIILAMGSPKQETVANAIAASVAFPTVIASGGAIADNLALRFSRAPLWVRRVHCEWLYRILLEPRRLWRRYLVGGFSFAWYVVRLRMVM